jgi:hypothetical protein
LEFCRRAEPGVLLANGDRWEREIAKNIAHDAPYRRDMA